jgi:anti-sigma regulatory factor (Ser/Thr protein kinase)
MTATISPQATGPLVHDALFYADDDEYLLGVLGFVREGLERNEPVLVALPGERLDLVRAALHDGEPDRVRLTDMTAAGRNPGRIIGGVLTPFVQEHPDRAVRMVGEPIWPGRTGEEYPACAEHEALINLALGDAPASILCPYDTARLPAAVLTDATRTHPGLASGTAHWPSPAYGDPGAVAASFDLPLTSPPRDVDVLVVSPGTGARAARRFVHEFAEGAGMCPERIAHLRSAVQELAVNTLVHSGGSGLLSIWRNGDEVVCQIQDGGRLSDPLAGRRPPTLPDAGHGLHHVHQVADLVRVHRDSQGTTVRVHVRLH